MPEDLEARLIALSKDPDLIRLESGLHQPNVFYALGLQHVEIRHSNFLAWLLRPHESHRLGDKFLKRFLKDIFADQTDQWIDDSELELLDLSGVEVRREWQHIDLLVISRGSKPFTICIENKLFSQEHSDQLNRYRSVIEKGFRSHKHFFVFLTPTGEEPSSEGDKADWQTYTYSRVASILESIPRISGNSTLDRTTIYVDDYLTVLRREIMKNDPLSALALEIYQEHREALDFILKTLPDRLVGVAPIFKELVQNSGWILGSEDVGYTRFLTKALDGAIPRSGMKWDGKKAFAFEFEYKYRVITFRTVIPPGNELHREVLSLALSKVPGARQQAADWRMHRSFGEPFDVTDRKYTDSDIRERLAEMWPQVVNLVTQVEAAILAVRAELKPC